MNVKGTTVAGIKNFVNEMFSAYFDEWLEKLPPKSRSYFTEEIFSGDWYPMYETAIIPTRLVADMFFDGNRDEAYYEIGIFSGKKSMTEGVYKELLKGLDREKATKFIGEFYNIYFSEGHLTTKESNEQVVFEYRNQPKYAIENLPRITGYLEIIYRLTKTPPQKIDWSHRKEADGSFTGINTVYFDENAI